MKLKDKIIASVIILAVLIAAFFSGSKPNTSKLSTGYLALGVPDINEVYKGSLADIPESEHIIEELDSETDSSDPDEEKADLKEDNAEITLPEAKENEIEEEKEEQTQNEEAEEKNTENPNLPKTMVIEPETGKDKYLTDPVPEGKPIPIEPQEAEITDEAKTCYLSVRCNTILDNLDMLDPEKVELVPADGIILEKIEVIFYDGESVFNVLQREMKKNGIHMEFVNTPMYNSAYIEGINNLYEFDCGELSGWMYKVNGWFPNYGCSRYQLQQGDVIEWVFTCDLGRDVGDQYYSVSR